MQESISRRNFIKGAGVAAGAASTMTIAANCALADEATWDYEADVVVVGFGGAGAVSAITAHDAGASVIVIEKQAQDTEDAVNQTNSTRLSHSCLMDFTDEAGAEEYLKAACRGNTPDDVLEEFAKYVVGTAAYINGLGGAMNASEDDCSEYPYDVFPEGQNYTAYLSDGLGNGLWKSLEAAVNERDIQVLFETPGKKLVTNENGAVIGVVADQDGKEISLKAAKGVVIAAGGYEFNFDMQKQFFTANPCRFNGNPDNTGDGIKMAQEVGADLWHTSLIGGEPIPYIDEIKHGVKFRGQPSVWVDKYGRRFAGGPTAVNNTVEGTIPNHTGSYAALKWDYEKCDFSAVPFFVVFDQSTIDDSLVIVDFLGAVKGDYVWSSDFSDEVQKGWVLKGETLEELAAQIAADSDDAGKMDAATLAETLKTFNEYCAAGEDPEFHTAVTGLNAIENPPYYAMKMYPGSWNTFGGPKRNARGQIVKANGEAIEGLYGAGECGSVLGFLYAGGGWNICEVVASGRIAGEEVAAQESRA